VVVADVLQGGGDGFDQVGLFDEGGHVGLSVKRNPQRLLLVIRVARNGAPALQPLKTAAIQATL
jgi:hypothetical protein